MHIDARRRARERHLPTGSAPPPGEAIRPKLHDLLLRTKVHLIAANPKIRQAIFPSKIWEQPGGGRRLLAPVLPAKWRQS